MDDLISRQLVIKTLCERRCGNKSKGCPSGFCTESLAVDCIPSAQPYTEAEIQTMQELEQAELQKAYECGRASAQSEIVRCKDCKYWRRQTNYAGTPLSFGFCESDEMWRSLYGETYEVSHIDTDDDFYCGYAERREE